MNQIEKIIAQLMKRRTNNEVNIPEQLPLDTLIVKNGEEFNLISVIGNIDYERKIVLTDLKGTVLKELLAMETGSHTRLARDQDYLYVAGDCKHRKSKIYKFSLSDYSMIETHEFDGEITQIVVDETNFFVYDSNDNMIIKLDKDFNYIDSIDAKNYFTNGATCPTEITSGNGGYIGISRTPWNTEEDYMNFQAFLIKTFGKKVYTNGLNIIHSIAYDKNRDKLYIAFYDFICIVENNLCSSFLYFPQKGIISINYDNGFDFLTVCHSNLKKNSVDGSTKILSNKDVEDLKINISPFPLFNSRSITTTSPLSLPPSK